MSRISLRNETMIQRVLDERQIKQFPGWATWTIEEAEANIRAIVGAQNITNQAQAIASLKKLEDVTVQMAKMMVMMRNLIIKPQT